MLSTNKTGTKDICDFALLLGAVHVYFSPQNIRSQDILCLLTTILRSHWRVSSTSNLHSRISKIMPVNTTNEWDSNSTKIVEVVSKGNKWGSDLYDLQLIKSTSSLYRYMATWWARFQSVVHTDMSVKHPQRVAKAITSVLQHATWRPHPNVQFSTDSANEVWGCWSYWEGCVLVL